MPDTPLPVSRWFMQCFCFPAYEPVSTNPTHTSLHSARRPDVRLCPTGLRRLSALRTLFPDPSCTSFVRHPRFACIVPILHLYHSIFVLTPHRLYPLLTLDIIPNAFSVRCFGPVAHEWRKTPTARAVQSVGGLREPVLAMRSSAPGGAPAPGDTVPSGGGRATQKVAVLRARLLNSSTACVCSPFIRPRPPPPLRPRTMSAQDYYNQQPHQGQGGYYPPQGACARARGVGACAQFARLPL
jgi:hypothetical protein